MMIMMVMLGSFHQILSFWIYVVPNNYYQSQYREAAIFVSKYDSDIYVTLLTIVH